MLRRRNDWAALAAISATLVAAACGGATEAGSAPTPAPKLEGNERSPGQLTGTQAPRVVAPASNSVVIDGIPAPVSITSCGFDPEDAGNRDLRFVAEGTGTSPRHGTFRLWFADVDDGTRRLQRLELTFTRGDTITGVARVSPAASPPFSFDPHTLTLGGQVIATRVPVDRAPAMVEIEVRATCPPLTDGQQPQLRSR